MRRFINWLLGKFAARFAARFEKHNPNFDRDGQIQ